MTTDHTADIDAAFDRLAVPSWIRPALRDLLVDAWDEGEQAGRGGAPGRGIVPNPYRVTPPGQGNADA